MDYRRLEGFFRRFAVVVGCGCRSLGTGTVGTAGTVVATAVIATTALATVIAVATTTVIAATALAAVVAITALAGLALRLDISLGLLGKSTH